MFGRFHSYSSHYPFSILKSLLSRIVLNLKHASFFLSNLLYIILRLVQEEEGRLLVVEVVLLWRREQPKYWIWFLLEMEFPHQIWLHQSWMLLM
jgi:hypothetical protein